MSRGRLSRFRRNVLSIFFFSFFSLFSFSPRFGREHGSNGRKKKWARSNWRSTGAQNEWRRRTDACNSKNLLDALRLILMKTGALRVKLVKGIANLIAACRFKWLPMMCSSNARYSRPTALYRFRLDKPARALIAHTRPIQRRPIGGFD